MLVQGHGGNGGKQRALSVLAQIFFGSLSASIILTHGMDAEAFIVVRLAQRMAALLGDARGKEAKTLVVRDQHIGRLLTCSTGPPHQAPDRLAKEKLGEGVSRVDPDAQARNVYTFGDHAHGDDPRGLAVGKTRDLA